MRFIDFDQPGDPDVLRLSQANCPEPKPEEVLINVKACGVNRPDIFQRKGIYPPPPGASPILGLEVAGTIAALGANSKPWKIGDEVCALVNGGGYAEFCIAPSSQCLPVPKGLSMVEASAIPETFFTVWSNLFIRGKLSAHETLLVHGGSSGIGTTAIQLATAFGARVFVTAGSDEKCAYCIKLGAHSAINYRKNDFVEEITRLNKGRGIDVILDMVGGDYFKKNVDLLALEGRLLQIATLKGEEVTLSLATLMKKNATITGSLLRPQTGVQKSAIAAELRNKVWPLLESGDVRVMIDHVYPFDEANKAHMRMESSKHMGKIVLKL